MQLSPLITPRPRSSRIVSPDECWEASRRKPRGSRRVRLADGSSAPVFTPASLANIVAWFRADLGVTLNGGTIVTIADQSGAGVLPTLTQSSAGVQPTFIAAGGSGINGLADISWSASCLANSTTVLGTTALTLFAIFQTSQATSGCLWGMQFNAYHYNININSGIGAANKLSYNTADATAATSDNALNDGLPHVAISTWSTADNTARLYIDGTVASVTTAASSTAIAAGGGDLNAAGAGTTDTTGTAFAAYTGRMPEWGAIARVISAGERSQLVTYLKGRAGI